MNKFGTILATAALTLMASGVSALTIIDDFTTYQRVQDTPDGSPNNSVLFAPEAIGGSRKMTVATDAPNPPGSDGATQLQSFEGILSFSNADGVTGTGTIVYDAFGVGLGGGAGVDLTSGGSDNKFFFAVNSFDLLGAAEFSLTVEDADAGMGTYNEVLDAGFDPYLYFSDAAFAGVNFEKVTSLTFQITSTTASFDGSLSSISVVPLPASALLLLGGLGGFAGLSAAAKRRRRKS